MEAEEGTRQLFVVEDIAAITRANAPAQFQQATPRVEIKCSIGAANRHRFCCPDGFARYDRWRCTLSIQCVTTLAGDGQESIHEQFLGLIRSICSTLAQETWDDFNRFPNVRFAEPLLDAGDTNTSKSAEGMEYTVINFTGTLCIRESAWPVPPVIPPLPPIVAGPPLQGEQGEIITGEGGEQILAEQ